MTQLTLVNLNQYDIFINYISQHVFKKSPLAWDMQEIAKLPKLYLKLILYRFHQPTSGTVEILLKRIENFRELAKLIKTNFYQTKDGKFHLKLKPLLSKVKEIKQVFRQLHFGLHGDKISLLFKALNKFLGCYSKTGLGLSTYKY
jgi:hypothetical protein